MYGFIGPNGAGKSTTMKMLLGLIHPSAGQVTLLGQPMNAQNRLALLQKTGSLIESPAGYGHLTGQENLEIVADLKGVPRKDIARVLDIVHLTGRPNTAKCGSIRSACGQRLGIAQALLGSPQLLILDEPTNGLDPAGIQEMRALIAGMPDACGRDGADLEPPAEASWSRSSGRWASSTKAGCCSRGRCATCSATAWAT